MLITAFAVASVLSSCQLHFADGRWKGACGPILDETPVLSIARAKAITTGAWRKDSAPSEVWAGEASDADTPHAPVELEVYLGGEGILRTVYEWVPIHDFHGTDQLVEFTIDAAHPVAPTDLDRQIVEHAAAFLSSESVWNRADNRKCAASAPTRSIYCAMHDATIEVTGGFHHRRPAMEVVRQIVDER
jgi:hypothetical protein